MNPVKQKKEIKDLIKIKRCLRKNKNSKRKKKMKNSSLIELQYHMEY